MNAETPRALPAAPAPDPWADEELYLLGATRLADFLEFVANNASTQQAHPRADLADRWRAAAAVYDELQRSQQGVADFSTVLPLNVAAQAQVDALVKLPTFQKTFDTVPVAFGMVELDRLVVSQHHITQSSLAASKAALKSGATDTAVAELCLPTSGQAGDLRLAKHTNTQSVFVASNHDARFLGAHVVDASTISGLAVNGHAQTVIALVMGFTTNVLNVVRYGPRMVLNNGYHRALALRAAGITHAPCLIQVCEHWEDVGLVGSSEMFHNGDVYFSRSRPPMLRDFANPALCHRFATRKRSKQIQLSFNAESMQLPI